MTKSGVPRSSILYWFASPIPTLIVIVDAGANRGWYAWHMDLFRSPRDLPPGDSDTVTIRIPESNRLDQNGWADIRERLRRFYGGLQKALRIADASSILSPVVRTLVLGVRNLTSVAHLRDDAPDAHPDLMPILALHEQTQHRDILAAVRRLIAELDDSSEATQQIRSWIEAYEATALLAYPFLRELPDGNEFGPDVKVGVVPEIVPEVRARLMTASLDMTWSLMSGHAPISHGLQQPLTKLAEPDGAANGSQSIRSEKN